MRRDYQKTEGDTPLPAGYTRLNYIECSSLDNWYSYLNQRNTSYNKCCDITSQGITLLESVTDSTWRFVYNQNCDTHVSLMSGCSGYVRNLYIFATALSDEDIMTIYRHDHQ